MMVLPLQSPCCDIVPYLKNWNRKCIFLHIYVVQTVISCLSWLKESTKMSKHSDDSHSSAMLEKIHHQKEDIEDIVDTVLDVFDVCSIHALSNYNSQESKN